MLLLEFGVRRLVGGVCSQQQQLPLRFALLTRRRKKKRGQFLHSRCPFGSLLASNNQKNLGAAAAAALSLSLAVRVCVSLSLSFGRRKQKTKKTKPNSLLQLTSLAHQHDRAQQLGEMRVVRVAVLQFRVGEQALDSRRGARRSGGGGGLVVGLGRGGVGRRADRGVDGGGRAEERGPGGET